MNPTFRRHARRLSAKTVLMLLTVVGLAPSPTPAQQPTQRQTLRAQPAATPVKLSAVLTAFLVDSGVRTTGLPWTTGSALPIRWTTPRPVPNTDPAAVKRGMTKTRDGKFLGTLGDSIALGMYISVWGTDSGVTGVSVTLDSMLVELKDGSGFFLHREMLEVALRNEGLTFQPLKCKRETEGASYGNLIDAMKAPGKTASGLWWAWDSPQQQTTIVLTILYRRAEMNQVECHSG